MVSRFSSRLAARLAFRLLAIQGLWNYRTMLGAGLAWVLLPALRVIHADDEEALARALRLHGEHFNAHPYLAGFAAGALARMAREGVDPDQRRRFRDALKGPLGSLGDVLVWSAWLPLCVLGSGVAALVFGVGPVAAAMGFLVVFNMLHLVLRWWGVHIGLELGRMLGQALRRWELPLWAERMGRAGVFLLGLLAGFALGAGAAPSQEALSSAAAGLFALAGIAVFSLGWLRGRSLPWWTPVTVLVAVAMLLVVGSPG